MTKRINATSKSPRPPAERKHPLGEIVPRVRSNSSKVEERVRKMLQDRGIELLGPDHSIQAGFDPDAGYWPILAPDFIVKGERVVVEVDPPGSPKGPAGHDMKREMDEHRNRLLADAGWAVVRLRLGLGRGSAIGPHDVETESVSTSVAAIDALAEAVRDAIAGIVGTVRFVPKNRAPQRKATSRLGAISPNDYEDGWHVSWLEETGEKSRYVLLDGGDNLYGAVGWDLEFVANVGLKSLARKDWRPALEEFFASTPSPVPVSRFPWGSEFFVGSPELNDRMIKMRVSASAYRFTANIPSVTGFTPTAIVAGDSIFAELHPEALRWGWTITKAEIIEARRGEYLEVVMMRSEPV